MVKELLTLSRPLLQAAEKLIYFHFGFTDSLRCLCRRYLYKILNFTDILIHTHTHTHIHTPLLLFRVVVQSLSCVRLFATTWTAECQASLSFTISQSLLEKIHLWRRLNFWFTISILPVLKIPFSSLWGSCESRVPTLHSLSQLGAAVAPWLQGPTSSLYQKISGS